MSRSALAVFQAGSGVSDSEAVPRFGCENEIGYNDDANNLHDPTGLVEVPNIAISLCKTSNKESSMDDQLQRMCEIVERHCERDRQTTAIEGLTLFRMDTSVHLAHIVYKPRICIILRGSKTVSLAQAPFDADASTFLFVTVDVPVSSMVYRCKDGKPHIGLALDLDRVLAAEVLRSLSPAPSSSLTPTAVIAKKIRPVLLDSVARLLELLDSPSDVDFMKPLILQEIYYRLVSSGLREPLAQYAASGSHLSQISKAISWIREHYRDPMNVNDLADLAGMSVTSFYRHFKAATLMTPIQYRAEIRLQEARRMMLSTGAPAGDAGAAVGYDSQSQFSREYKRKFGAPPALDATRFHSHHETVRGIKINKPAIARAAER